MRTRPFLWATVLAAVMATSIATLVAIGIRPSGSRPILTREGVLPPGAELNDDLIDLPTERFRSEVAGGRRSYLFNLGDVAFGSPEIFGGRARQAGISCETCHQGGAGNPRLFIPGASLRPGTFDATSGLFAE
jgi:hypothetical protein